VAKLQDHARRNGITLYEALAEAQEVDLTGAAKKACGLSAICSRA
jgi:hypothetical protein